MKTMMTILSCLVLSSASCNTPSDSADRDAPEAAGHGASLAGLGRKTVESPRTRVAPGPAVDPALEGVTAPTIGGTAKVEPRTLRIDVAAEDGQRHYRVSCDPGGACDIVVGGAGTRERMLKSAVALSSSCVQLGGDIEMAKPKTLDAVRLDVIGLDPTVPGRVREDSRPPASTAAMLLLGSCDDWVDQVRGGLSEPEEIPRVGRLVNCQLEGERFVCNQIKAERGENLGGSKEDEPQPIETRTLCMDMCANETKIAPDFGCACD